MKGKFLALAMMCLSTTLTSCFKDEPLNAECDIEQAYIHVDNPEAMFFSKNDTLVNVLSSLVVLAGSALVVGDVRVVHSF